MSDSVRLATALRLLPVILCLSAAPLVAQDDPCLVRTIPVTAIDAHGNPVQELQASNLVGKLRGQPVEILSATLNTRPRRIMVVVDMSGTMLEPSAGKWPVTRTMLEDVGQAAPIPGQIGMEFFAENVFGAVSVSPNPESVRMRVAWLQSAKAEDLVPKGEQKTALWDALWQATDQLTPPRPGDVIYVLTDGGDNRSHHTDKELEEKLLSRGIRVFAFIPTVPMALRARTPEEESGPRPLKRILYSTGGSLIYLCPDPRETNCEGFPNYSGDWTKSKKRSLLLDAAHRLYQEMAVYYDVAVRFPTPVEKMSKWDLALTDDRSHKRKDIELLFPHRLPPCKEATFTRLSPQE